MKIQKWGNSLGIRIPGSFAEQLNINVGSEVELLLRNTEMIIRPIRKKPELKDLLSRVTPENRHQEINYGKPEGNEIW
ncbi:AbrB/MazE/SpoVT family DNA-binding domain-containing protein [Paenibacillus sp. J2TS4]|uniref:AbrB/MazE/SpoVT family DNA-binding domain-containing protein n=1 Tax=Paenibacillus sp. J2TS4 TaxID=2807194 RepID=UPI001AFFEEF0|nr:AbrB/MazE/SpoVT family DNA-binding domain-containing protein [Paenibacillus sp. J2TS4]GIP34079.1 multidrug transporter MatE [Paenibacillus sp. J2TS4]